MARFDVFPNPGPHATTTPYLLDVQSNMLDELDSRMVVPLRSLEHFVKVKLPLRLTPILRVDGKDYLLETRSMARIVGHPYRDRTFATFTPNAVIVHGKESSFTHG